MTGCRCCGIGIVGVEGLRNSGGCGTDRAFVDLGTHEVDGGIGDGHHHYSGDDPDGDEECSLLHGSILTYRILSWGYLTVKGRLNPAMNAS